MPDETLADLMRSVGIREDRPRAPRAAVWDVMNAPRPPLPRTRADLQAAQDNQFAQQRLAQQREAFNPGIDRSLQRDHWPGRPSVAAEAGQMMLENTGLPSMQRSGEAFRSGEPLRGAGELGMGLLGVAGTAGGLMSMAPARALPPRPPAPVRAYRGLRAPYESGADNVATYEYWTANPRLASQYATEELPGATAPNVVPGDINTRNFLSVDAGGAAWDNIPIAGIGDRTIRGRFPNQNSSRGVTSRQLTQYAEDAGYDGVTFNNMRDAPFSATDPDIAGPNTIYGVINRNARRGQFGPLDATPPARPASVPDGRPSNEVAYRGLNRPYDPNNGGYYQSFTSSADDAREYGPHVMAANLRLGRNLAIDGGGNNFNSIGVAQLPAEVRARLHPSIGNAATTDQIAHAAREAGYDSVTVRNVHDTRWGERPAAGEPRTLNFVFDTSNISPLEGHAPPPSQAAPASPVRLSASDRALLDELERDLSPPERPNGGPLPDPNAVTRLPVNPSREIGPNGLPIREREPFRNSLRGGSDDLREAARPQSSSALALPQSVAQIGRARGAAGMARYRYAPPEAPRGTAWDFVVEPDDANPGMFSVQMQLKQNGQSVPIDAALGSASPEEAFSIYRALQETLAADAVAHNRPGYYITGSGRLRDLHERFAERAERMGLLPEGYRFIPAQGRMPARVMRDGPQQIAPRNPPRGGFFNGRR